MEEVVANPKCVEKIREPLDIHVRCSSEPENPFREKVGLLCVHGRIRTKCGKNEGGNAGSADLLMVFEGIGRVIRGADSGHMEFFQDSVHRQVFLPKPAIRAIPDTCRGLFAEQIVDTKITLQLEMSPMVERIAKRMGNSARPSTEFFKGSAISGAEFFRYTVSTHGPRLVVVTVQPN